MSEIPQQSQPPQIPDLPYEVPVKTRMATQAKAGIWVLIGGVLFTISPLIFAFLFSAGGNMFDESSGGGAAIWFMLMTIPVGGIVSIVGIVFIIMGNLKKS